MKPLTGNPIGTSQQIKASVCRKTPEFLIRNETIIFKHDNTRPSIVKAVKSWKIADGKFCLTRFIAQTLFLPTTLFSGRYSMPPLEYGSHQDRVSNISLIHSCRSRNMNTNKKLIWTQILVWIWKIIKYKNIVWMSVFSPY